eukprot:5048-Heterococcus_DN1.PRE.2
MAVPRSLCCSARRYTVLLLPLSSAAVRALRNMLGAASTLSDSSATSSRARDTGKQLRSEH